jgi:hypothetical protein
MRSGCDNGVNNNIELLKISHSSPFKKYEGTAKQHGKQTKA